MDQDRFDQLARLLGSGTNRRAGLRAALGGLLGLGAGAVALDADAKGRDRGKARGHGRDRDRADAARRRHECGPDQPCPSGFDCVKQGKKRRCSCASGVLCGGACCPTGQVCQDGACIVPAACIVPGEPCKGVGKPCCDGRTCSSGQGGEDDVACYVHKTGACQSTADCVYGTACLDGRCGFDVPPPAATGASCNPDVGQTCADPAATCSQYTGAGAPGGFHCILPLDVTCTGDPECTCYKCWYPNGTLAPLEPGSRDGRDLPEPEPRLACCGPEGYTCQSDRNCCLGTTCVNGTCQAVCDVCASGCPYATIKDAYFGMPAGSTIRIAPGEYGGVENFIDSRGKSMTFVPCGQGTVNWVRSRGERNLILQANSASPNTQMGFVGIDFTLGEGISDSNEFLKLNPTDGSNRVTVVGCRFAGNSSQAIDMGDLELFVYDSLFEDNVAFDAGAAIYVTTGRLTVHRTIFRNNSSLSNDGGGAIYQGSPQPMLIADSVCENNSAVGSRKGGCFNLNRGLTTLRNVQMVGNVAQGGGGAVYLHVSPASLSFEGTTTATRNSIASGQFGSGIQCFGGNCRNRISGTTDANVRDNTPADRTCAVNNYGNLYVVDCATWCLPAGSTVQDPGSDCPICCSGTCTGSTCD